MCGFGPAAEPGGAIPDSHRRSCRPRRTDLGDTEGGDAGLSRPPLGRAFVLAPAASCSMQLLGIHTTTPRLLHRSCSRRSFSSIQCVITALRAFLSWVENAGPRPRPLFLNGNAGGIRQWLWPPQPLFLRPKITSRMPLPLINKAQKANFGPFAFAETREPTSVFLKKTKQSCVAPSVARMSGQPRIR